MDSFTESSAQEFQNTVENQNGRDTVSESAETKSKELGGGINLSSLGIPVDVRGNVSNGSTTSNSMSEHVSAISTAMDSTSSQASHNRDVNVNTDVSTKSITELTESTVRELKNINIKLSVIFIKMKI